MKRQRKAAEAVAAHVQKIMAEWVGTKPEHKAMMKTFSEAMTKNSRSIITSSERGMFVSTVQVMYDVRHTYAKMMPNATEKETNSAMTAIVAALICTTAIFDNDLEMSEFLLLCYGEYFASWQAKTAGARLLQKDPA